ncbi:hypothetical protein COLO4_21464 [Corchorus olitorius]|uniref:Uncharacterized protein n=1 Tax=Corchorus olitorius TaxID=93759 RepID=A0A1R3IT85_9ROSI|nr:hypothetical protein COLO4_21464 [Corchorus olitorius]
MEEREGRKMREREREGARTVQREGAGRLLNELVEIGLMCMGGEVALQMLLMLILYNAY